MLKKICSFVLGAGLLLAPLLTVFSMPALALSGSEFQPGRIIDDSKFFTYDSPMSVSDIQNFLNAKVPVCDTNGAQNHSYHYNAVTGRVNFGGNPQESADPWVTTNRATYGQRYDAWHSVDNARAPYTCLKNYHTSIPARSAEPGLCNDLAASGMTAAEILYWVGQSCGVNPQVLIVLLQKEQALVTDDWPWKRQYRSATGYGCPDHAPCDAEYYGFFNQVYNAARIFKYYAKIDGPNYRQSRNNNILWHPNTACGSSTVFIENQATAGLYNYTPYRPNAAALNNLYGMGDTCSSYGNRNFWRIFNDWFGSTFGPPDYSCKSGVNVVGAGSGSRVVSNQFSSSGNALFTLSQLNETGSKCVEMHTWNSTQQGWLTNVATNLTAVNPPDGEVISGNIYGDGKSELMLVSSRTSGSGKLEIHTWDNSYQRWLSNVATNHPITDPADSDVVVADTNGDGRDELVFVKYRNTGSGRVEIHEWSADRQSWVANTATNLPAIDPADGRVIAANLYGNAADELVFVKYRNTGSEKVEIHAWAGGQQSWLSNVATNHGAVSPDDAAVIAGNIYGGAIDELVFVKYRNTGSGRIELHTWAAGQQSWLSNVATNHGSL